MDFFKRQDCQNTEFLSLKVTFTHSFHYTPFNPQIRCVAADTLWQPSSLCFKV